VNGSGFGGKKNIMEKTSIINYHLVIMQIGNSLREVKVFDCENNKAAKAEAKRMEKGKVIKVTPIYQYKD
jgi:hypothetical protein